MNRRQPFRRIRALALATSVGLLLMGVALFDFRPIHAGAAFFCVRLENNGAVWRNIRTHGREMRVSFQHSLYGSRVEEVFHLLPTGFRLSELRYGERRLVEFYGHESARYENPVWIVRPTPALHSSLSLHASIDASMSLWFDRESNLVKLTVPTDSAVRLTIADCKDARDG